MARRHSDVIPFRSARGLAAPVPPVPPVQAVQPVPSVAAAVSPAFVRATSLVHEVTPLAKWATAGAVFLAISKFHGYVTPLAIVRAPMLMSVIALVLLFMDTKAWRPADLKRHWIPRVLGVLTVIAIGSIPFGIYQGQSLVTFNQVLSRTLLIALMVWAVARTEKGMLFMVRVLTVSIITSAFLAVSLGRRDSTGRLAGGYAYDPNDIALLAVTGIPLVIWWALDKRNKNSIPVLLSLPLLFMVIIRSQSRGGFLGLLAMTVGFILLGLGPVEKKVKRIALIAGLGIIMAIPFFPAKYLTQMKTITSDSDYNQTSITGRKEVWKRGFSYALAHPLFGVGLGNFNSAEGRSEASLERSESGKGFKWGTAHNSYVQVMSELGFIGGACFVTLIFGSIITLIIMHRRGGHGDMLAPLFALSMTGFAASAFFLSWGYYDLPYVMIAIACAMLMRWNSGLTGPRVTLAQASAPGPLR
jgi:O-antigen ligase